MRTGGRLDQLRSMSRKGDCWDNAVAESFFSTIKTELIGNRIYGPHDEATVSIRRIRRCVLQYESPPLPSRVSQSDRVRIEESSSSDCCIVRLSAERGDLQVG